MNGSSPKRRHDGKRRGREGGIRDTKWAHHGLATDCATSGYQRLIHDRETWLFLQDAHAHSRGRRRKHDGRRRHHGFEVGFEVRDDGPRGRSVYATEALPRGTRVYRGTYVVRFDDRSELVGFLSLLPAHLQCDVLLWAFPGKHGQAYVALDEGSYVNHGETKALVTLDDNCVTTRDLKAGEELLEDYGEFVGTEPGWFSKIRDRAWANEGGKPGEGASVNQYVRVGAPKLTSSKRPQSDDDDGNMGNVMILQSKQLRAFSSISVILMGIMVAGLLYKVRVLFSRQKYKRSSFSFK